MQLSLVLNSYKAVNIVLNLPLSKSYKFSRKGVSTSSELAYGMGHTFTKGFEDASSK